MRLLSRYILREHIAPFFISISLIMLLFTLNLLFRMLSRIVGQGLPFNVIAEYFILNLAWYTRALLIDEKTGMLHSVTIFDDSDQKQPSTVLADSGRLSFIDSLGMYQFLLYHGQIHQLKRDEPEGYEILNFEEATFRFDASNQLLKRRESGYRGDRELDLSGLLSRISELRSREDAERQQKQINRYLVEYHKKFSISAAVLVFVLIGAPLGVKLHRGGLGVSGGLSIFFFLLYWVFLIGGEDLADRGLVDPWLAMWAANILLAVIGFILIRLEMRQHVIFKFPWQKHEDDDEGNSADWNLSADIVEEQARSEAEKVEDRRSEIPDSGPSENYQPGEEEKQ